MTAADEILLPAEGAFDAPAALATVRSHTIDGLHHLEEGMFLRRVTVAGDSLPIALRLRPDGVLLRSATRDEGTRALIAARVRHWFDLATDVAPIDAHLGADPLFAAQVRERPGIRITRFGSPFEAAVLIVLGQQVSLAAGRLFAGRLIAAHGTAQVGDRSADARPLDASLLDGCTVSARPARGLRDLPTPAVLAAVPVEELREQIGLTRGRARTLHEVAALFADAGIDAATGVEPLPPRAELQALFGVGPWTLDCLAIRAGEEADAFPATDAVLRRALSADDARGGSASDETWRPYRSYATVRLWATAG